MKEYTVDEPKFSPHIFITETTDEGHADNINAGPKQLLSNTLVLNQEKAPCASPVLTGTPKAPTALSGTNNTQIATTAFTQATVSDHDTSAAAHNNIRNLISQLTTRLNALADSDDTTLDQLSEIVAYIKNNKSLIDGITTSKVSVSDIIDSLTSTAENKPLSAKQGKALKDLLDTLTFVVGNKVDIVSGKGLSANDYTTAEKNKLSEIAAGAEVNIQSDWNVTDTNSDAYIKNKPAIPDCGIYGAEKISLGRNGAAGSHSVAAGYSAMASGDYSYANGYCCSATGDSSNAQGKVAYATGEAAFAHGKEVNALGSCSHVMGYHNQAEYDFQTVMGKYNQNKQENLLEVGNGFNLNEGTVGDITRKNALELDVYGNLTVEGNITDGNGVVLRDVRWKCVNPNGTVGGTFISLPADAEEIWVLTMGEADTSGMRPVAQTHINGTLLSGNNVILYDGSYLNAAWGMYAEWTIVDGKIHLNTLRRTVNSTLSDLKAAATTWVYNR